MTDNKTIKKSIIITVLFVLVFAVLSLGAATLPWISYQVIKNGFDEPLCAMLEDEYSVNVPSDAEFIKGKHSGFNDTYVTLFWRLPANGKDVSEVIFPMLDEDAWSFTMNKDSGAEPDSYAQMTMEYSHTSYGKAYSSIKHTDVKDDGYVYVVFCGWRPSMKDVDTKIKLNLVISY